MDINPLLTDAHGRSVFTFGGQDAYATELWGGYFVSLEWFVGRRTTEPIMMIQSAQAGHDNGAFGICLSSIGKYADPDTPSNAAPGAMAACYDALATLGKAPLAIEARKLLDVILHFASRLIAMPPTPRAVVQAAQPRATMDVVITDEKTGKTHSEVSI